MKKRLTHVHSDSGAFGSAAPSSSSPTSPLLLSRRRYLAWSAAGLTAPLLSACGGSGRDTAAFAPLSADSDAVRWCRDGIRATLARSDSATTAISVALLAGDEVVWSEAFGQSDRENKVAATVDTRFSIGSVSKMMATVAVMILRDRGLLTLDQPVADLLPAFTMLSPGYRRITVRHLLTHSSGVPGTNPRNLFAFVPMDDYEEDTLHALSRSHLKHEPGELAVYCNDGFTLVGPLVQALTGLRFADFMQQAVFEPLGMRLSAYPTAPLPEGAYVHPYYEGRQLPQEMTSAYATGGVLSTPTDMMKFARLFINEGTYEGRRILSAQAVRDMGIDQRSSFRINPVDTVTWGLGWDAVRQQGLDAAGLRAWQKGGDTFFFSTDFIVLPDARLAMMISGNGFDYGKVALGEGLLLRAAREQGSIPALPAPIVPALPPAASTATHPANVTGVYATGAAPFQVTAANDGSLTLSMWGNDGKWNAFPGLGMLRERNDGNWWADESSGVSVRFRSVEGHRYLISRSLSANHFYWSENVVGEWLPPLAEPLPGAWRARIGSRWVCVNEDPRSMIQVLEATTGRIDELQALPGYVMWNNEQLLRVVGDNTAGMTVKSPGFSGRDLVELTMVAVTDPANPEAMTEELHIGSMVYRRVFA